MLRQKLGRFFSRFGYLFYIFLIVFIFVTLCSKCSFLYPFNDWVDSNVYFTIGKAMLHGKVLYRDIFDHKGLYIFVIHSLAYLISDKSFAGVYLIQLVTGFFYGLALYRILLLYIDKLHAAVFLPVLVFMTYAAVSYCHGDSAEEIMLPMFGWSLLWLLQYARGERLGFYRYALSGAFAAVGFWIKFTLCGLFFGWILLAFIFEIKDGSVKRAFIGAACFAAAFVAATAPVLIYFAVNGALGDMFEVYIYNNVFVYTGSGGSGIFAKIGSALYGYIISIGYGYTYYISIIPAFIYLARSKQFTRREKIAVFVLYALTNFFIFAGGRKSKYYGLPSCIFAYTGAVALCRTDVLHNLFVKIAKRTGAAVSAVVIALSCLAFLVSPNVGFMFYKKSDLIQYKFAEIIEQTPDATILNYGTLDLGLYTVTGTIPDCKYYFKPNINLEVITDTQNRWVTEGISDYVVCVNTPPENIELHYELAAEGTQKYEGKMMTYYLYKLSA